MLKFTFREKVLVVLLGLSFSYVVTGQLVPNLSARETLNSDLKAELENFTDVLSIIKTDYVSDVNDKKLIDGAITGMVSELDPHSTYFSPDNFKEFEGDTEGEFGGLGIEVSVKDGLLTVITPMDGSPAIKAGVKPGDRIVKIDGVLTKQYSTMEAIRKLRGEKGSIVKITVLRGKDELLDLDVVRDVIAVDSVRSRMLGGGIAYIRVSQFIRNSAEDFIESLKELKETGVGLQGLILDLRNNPGGLLNQAVKISDVFLNEGVIVYTKGRVEDDNQKFYAHSKDTEGNYPVVILVNSGSASAAEIVSGALKVAGRAIVVGEQTFGKGSVQTVKPLENGGALSITTSLYYLANDNSIQSTGVSPDYVISENPEVDFLRESDLPGALANPTGKSFSIESEKKKKLVVKDPPDYLKDDLGKILGMDLQFKKAWEVISGMIKVKSEL